MIAVTDRVHLHALGYLIGMEAELRTDILARGDYPARPSPWDDLEMVQHRKSQRRPVEIEISGKSYEVLAVGHVANALHRCVWTVGHWERIRLLPEPAVVAFHGEPYTRRRLYFVSYVYALTEIRKQGYMNTQLLREDQERFQAEAWQAYQTLVVPITGGVVIDCTDQMPFDKSGQGSPRHDLFAS